MNKGKPKRRERKGMHFKIVDCRRYIAKSSHSIFFQSTILNLKSQNAYSLSSATALELEAWAIPSAYARPAEFAGQRSFEVEAMAARAADVPAFAVLSGQSYLLWEAKAGDIRHFRNIPALKLYL